MELPDSRRAGRLRSWLVPDLALSAAAVTAFFCLFLFGGSTKLFRDSDTGWHVRNGERILVEGVLPRTDPYSWTRPGNAWYAWEWGADVAMGAAHRWRGLEGVTALFVALIGVATWLWFRLTWAMGGDFLLACALASPMLSTTNMHWLARPHIFSWCLVLIWLIVMERREPLAWRWYHLAAAAGFGAVWANVHASFFFGPAIAFLYAGGYWLQRILWPETGAPPPGGFVLAGLAAAVGSLLNPYGTGLHVHVFHYVTNRELLQRVGEFQTFNFHSEGSAQILATVVISLMGAAFALVQHNVPRALLLVGFSVLALRSARALPMLALMLPAANAAIRGVIPHLGQVSDALRYSGNLRKLDSRLGGLALVPLLLALVAASPQRAGFPGSEFPIHADAAVEALPPQTRLFAPDKFGGYLIYRFAGTRKIFFDGRSDFYGIDFMKQYIDLVQVRPGWETLLARWNPTHALLPLNYSLRAALEKSGWKILHTGPVAVLLEAPAR
ncbi:MAG: hypothetical protein FJW39_05690 [Acidobacteria bacterium]|nr:hypothetical protein [Acidobacteriota bacterium]